jgi:hypothetical protein
MKFYKISEDDSNKLWKKKLILDDVLYLDVECKTETNYDKNELQKLKNDLYCKYLIDGATTPITSIGADYYLFSIPGMEKLELNGVEFKVVNVVGHEAKYRLLHFKNRIPCANLALSYYAKWPDNSVRNSWDNPVGSYFVTLVLDGSKIDPLLDGFSVSNWGAPTNSLVVSEGFREKILALEFDKRYIIFEELEIS